MSLPCTQKRTPGGSALPFQKKGTRRRFFRPAELRKEKEEVSYPPVPPRFMVFEEKRGKEEQGFHLIISAESLQNKKKRKPADRASYLGKEKKKKFGVTFREPFSPNRRKRG